VKPKVEATGDGAAVRAPEINSDTLLIGLER